MQLVLHSVSYAGFWPGQAALSLEELVPRAARLGYEGVMLVAKRPHLSLLDYLALRRGRLFGARCGALRRRLSPAGRPHSAAAAASRYAGRRGHPYLGSAYRAAGGLSVRARPG